jgi:hypothetical protein
LQTECLKVISDISYSSDISNIVLTRSTNSIKVSFNKGDIKITEAVITKYITRGQILLIPRNQSKLSRKKAGTTSSDLSEATGMDSQEGIDIAYISRKLST